MANWTRLFADWLIAFAREATPHDPEPDREQVMRAAGDGHGGRYRARIQPGQDHGLPCSDLRNPFSNRCYARIGFTPVCWSSHYPRAR
jgi:hypothetical protein